MQIDLNTRLSIAFIAGIVGLFWQVVILSVGGEPSEALVTAFSSIILACIGIGIKTNENSNSNNTKNQ